MSEALGWPVISTAAVISAVCLFVIARTLEEILEVLRGEEER